MNNTYTILAFIEVLLGFYFVIVDKFSLCSLVLVVAGLLSWWLSRADDANE